MLLKNRDHCPAARDNGCRCINNLARRGEERGLAGGPGKSKEGVRGMLFSKDKQGNVTRGDI